MPIPFMDHLYLGNPVRAWITAGIVLVAVFFVLWTLK